MIKQRRASREILEGIEGQRSLATPALELQCTQLISMRCKQNDWTW